jgi:uncharacterized protein YndB with AHSA1/START domain
MSRAFTVSEVIDSPTDRVWQVLVDWSLAPSWMPGVDSVTAGQVATGAVLRFRSRGREQVSKVTAIEPGRRLTLTSERGGVRADYQYSVAAESGGTRVTLDVDCVTRGAWKAAGPLLRVVIRRADSGQVSALKRFVETG